MRDRPLSVTAIAILHFVFGGLGILIGICAGVMMLAGGQNWITGSGGPGANQANMQKLQEDLQKAMESGPAYHAVQVGNLAVDLAISIIMIVSGLGLLQLRPWGRTLSILYAILSITHKVFGVVYAVVFTIPVLNNFLDSPAATGPEEQMAMTIMRMVAIFPPIVQVLCMIYPIIVLIIMLRPAIATAFREGGSPEHQRDQTGPAVYEDQ